MIALKQLVLVHPSSSEAMHVCRPNVHNTATFLAVQREGKLLSTFGFSIFLARWVNNREREWSALKIFQQPECWNKEFWSFAMVHTAVHSHDPLLTKQHITIVQAWARQTWHYTTQRKCPPGKAEWSRESQDIRQPNKILNSSSLVCLSNRGWRAACFNSISWETPDYIGKPLCS